MTLYLTLFRGDQVDLAVNLGTFTTFTRPLSKVAVKMSKFPRLFALNLWNKSISEEVTDQKFPGRLWAFIKAELQETR